MNRREAERTLDEIRRLMARAGEYRHLSGWAAILDGLLVLAGCAVSKWSVGVSFHPGNSLPKLAAIWGTIAAAGLALSLLLTVALARRRGEPAWSPAARQFLAGLLPGLYAGGVVTVFLVHRELYDALPGAWLVCYGTALMGASLFTPWEVRYFGLALLLFGGGALLFLRDYAMWAMGLGFGVSHLLFGVYVLRRYGGEGRPAQGRAEEAESGEDVDEESGDDAFRAEPAYGWDAGPFPALGYGDESDSE